MKYKVVRKQYNSKRCFVCGLENNYGLQARFYELETGELVAVFKPLDGHQSYPGVFHGGISATMLDETIGRAISVTHDDNIWGMTLELDLKYRKPVPLNVELKVVGRITLDEGRIFHGTGELLLPGGEVAVSAKGRYIKRRVDQITQDEFAETEWAVNDEMSIPEYIEL